MAAAKTHKSLVANPGGRSPVSKAKTASKTNPAKKRASGRKTTSTTTIKRKVVRRNPTGNATVNTLIAAFGGALAITGFDFVINYFMPQISSLVRTASKFGAAFLIGNYGKKLPLMGRYATGISNTLYLFGFVDLIANHVVPRVMPYLPQPAAAAAPPQIVKTASGELGALLQMPDGSQAVLIDETGAIDNSGYGYNQYSGSDYANNYQYGN